MFSGVWEEKSSGSGFWLWVLISVIVIGSFFLLLPVYREYGKKRDEYIQIKAERAALQQELLRKQKQVRDLESSPSEVEKVAREKFNQGRAGETTYIYEMPKEQKKK